MKIAVAQLNYRIADFEGNLAKMRQSLGLARNSGADLVVFSELAICGYPPLDLLEQRDFIDRCRAAIEELAKETADIGIIIGAPIVNPDPKGKKLLNAALLLHGGRVAEVRCKTLLPTYDIFDEYRYFEPNRSFSCLKFKGYRIALTICEDIWDDQPVENAFARTRLYPVSPMDELMKENPDLMINISASPFASNRLSAREDVLKQNVAKYRIPLIYCNQVGANTEIIFDGGSMVLNGQGGVTDRFEPFTADMRVYPVENLINPATSRSLESEPNLSGEKRVEMIYKALVFGIKDYFTKMGFSHAILGLSGGMDSALTLVLATEALGNKN
ncbi:MAG TPA: NAD+ synthase, partial [Bacteroidales bacterium]|nr:NAD+ synthase [Bacteroidales bacterium]